MPCDHCQLAKPTHCLPGRNEPHAMQVTGIYELDVYVEGKKISPLPFAISVEPGKTVPMQSMLRCGKLSVRARTALHCSGTALCTVACATPLHSALLMRTIAVGHRRWPSPLALAGSSRARRDVHAVYKGRVRQCHARRLQRACANAA